MTKTHSDSCPRCGHNECGNTTAADAKFLRGVKVKKTYADECLERASKATEGPWFADIGNRQVETHSKRYYQGGICSFGRSDRRDPDTKTNVCDDGEFIAHARTDVPELARRLKELCDELRVLEGVLRRGMPVHPDYIKELIDELERAPEVKE